MNLPKTVIKTATQKIDYLYDATERKIKQTVTNGANITTRFYAGAFEYEGSSLKLIHNEEGRVRVDGTTFTYDYYLKDHLGNTMVCFTKGSNGQAQVLQSQSYYPFGMSFAAYESGGTTNRYLYNGKEFQSDLGLDWYDYGARFYDPQIGRWHSVDPMAEQYRRWSQYNYCMNNPLRFIDPDGMVVGDYYMENGKYLGNDGIDDEKVYIAEGVGKNDEGKIEFVNSRQIGEAKDFVNMNGNEISSSELKQNLVGLSINMKCEGVTEGFAQINVVGGDRTQSSNQKAGGAKRSYHLSGQAADITVKGLSNEQLGTAASKSGLFGGVVFYPNWGDARNFGTHTEVTSHVPFNDDSHTKMVPVTSVVQNYQLLPPHIHVDMRNSKSTVKLQYTGNTTKSKSDNSYTYGSW